jgi:hypothetical protein
MPDEAPKLPNPLEKVRECILEKKYRLTDHAVERHLSRRITLPVIRHVLLTGEHYPLGDRFRKQFNRWGYAIRGQNFEGEEIKVIVSFSEEDDLMFIVTVMYLEDK